MAINRKINNVYVKCIINHKKIKTLKAYLESEI